MATSKAELIRQTKAEIPVVFCCSINLQKAVQSGLIGMLQREGYNEETQQRIVQSANTAIDCIARRERWNYQPGVDTVFGFTIFLGLTFILDKFATFNNIDLKAKRVKECIEDFERMEMSTIEETLKIQQHEEASDGEDDESETSAADLIEDHVTLTGPFTGTGNHVPGMFSWGTCVSHSAPQ